MALGYEFRPNGGGEADEKYMHMPKSVPAAQILDWTTSDCPGEYIRVPRTTRPPVDADFPGPSVFRPSALANVAYSTTLTLVFLYLSSAFSHSHVDRRQKIKNLERIWAQPWSRFIGCSCKRIFESTM
jgi:hypothetical protein